MLLLLLRLLLLVLIRLTGVGEGRAKLKRLKRRRAVVLATKKSLGAAQSLAVRQRDSRSVNAV